MRQISQYPVRMANPMTTLTPSQLNTLARDLLEGSFSSVLVEGEISNLARPASGHLYFTLKDARAQVRCAFFKGKSQQLKFIPRDGMHVLLRGKLTLYEARGDYQLILDRMEESGEGALRRAFEQLKNKLDAEGLFTAERKRSLPALPHRVAVLTSPSGAVIRDIVSVLRRRFPLLDLELLPVPVQGETAAAQIQAMLERADASGRYDVIVLARGGGSLEDLWPFNDEALTRSVANCTTPIISAIGHETDFSLTDFAADLRAPTPSAAAELLAPDAATLQQQLTRLQRQLEASHAYALQQRMQRLDRVFLQLQAQRPQTRLAVSAQRLSQHQQRLTLAMQHQLQQQQWRLRRFTTQPQVLITQRLQQATQRLRRFATQPQALIAQRLQQETQHLRGLARSLHAISPLATVARGYSILQDTEGHVVRSVQHLKADTHLQARLHDGIADVRVLTVTPTAVDAAKTQFDTDNR